MTEAEALKRFIPILGRISPPGERATITRNILDRIAGRQTSVMGISHKHAGALAWPNDTTKAIAFEKALNAAVDAGEFVSFLHSADRRHFQIEELCAWPDCPKVDTDSPLIFWLGDAFTEAVDTAPATDTAAPAVVPAGAAKTAELVDTYGNGAQNLKLSKESEAAFRQCLRILAPSRTPEQKRTQLRNAESYIQAGKWIPAMSLKDIALLFYPRDSVRESAMLAQMEQAIEANELTLLADKNRVLPGELAAWPDCPVVPTDSPLRYWLPDWMQATTAPVVAASNTPAIPKSKRPDLLTPLIEAALRGEIDPFNAAVVWPKLCSMAESKTRPLIGVSADGIKWTDGNDTVQFLTKRALSDRLRRMKTA